MSPSEFVNHVIKFRGPKNSHKGLFFDFTDSMNDGLLFKQTVEKLTRLVDRLDPDTIIGSGYGGAQLISGLLMRRPHLRSVLIRDKPHVEQNDRLIEGDLTKAHRCIFVDDAIFTGREFQSVLDVVFAAGAEMIGAIFIYDDDRLYSRQLKASKFPIYSIFNRRALGLTRDSLEQVTISTQFKWADYRANQNPQIKFKSAPCIYQDLIINATDQFKITAYSKVGEVKWELQLQHPESAVKGIVQDLAVSPDDFLYVAGYHGGVHKINPSSGEVLWSSRVSEYVHSTPQVKNGRVYVNCEVLDDRGRVVCLNSETGQVEWSYELPKFAPTTVCLAGDLIIAACNDSTLTALSESGQLLWTVKCKQPIKSIPLFHDGKIYVVDLKGLLYCFDVSGKLLFEVRAAANGWRSSPVFDGSSIVVVQSYIAAGMGHVSGYDPITGDRRWITRLRSPGVESCIVVKDGVLVFGRNTSCCFIDQSGKKLGEVKSIIDGVEIASRPTVSSDQIVFNTLSSGLFVYGYHLS